MIQLLDLVLWLTAHVDAQPLVQLHILLGDDHREVGVAALQILQLVCTMAARGLLSPEIDSASSTSSECSRGL